jgi:alcohol dehydrogenase (cytochrome c)
MRDRVRRYLVGSPVNTARAALLGVSLAALTASAFAAEYKMTVNKDRLLNAQNEPQNWLMMNGDYGSTRYSKLTQINRDNVKNLRLVWALALRGMQDVGQNGPENEVNPLIDNGFMYTTDGWGTVYKIDARNPITASSSGSPIPASSTKAMCRAPAVSRCGKTS